MTTQHATTNLDTAENVAPKHGMGDIGEARFVRKDLGAKRIGLAEYRMNPDQRIGFGHSHGESEEMYVVLAGSGRFKLEDEIIDVASKDVVYCPPSVMRQWESGPDGMHLLAFGAHTEGESSELKQGWWSD